jgi:hypothetical protein
MPCLCFLFEVVIGPVDLANATGNIVYPNNVVYLEYLDCDGNLIQNQFSAPGTQGEFCMDDTITPPILYYYQNDVYFFAGDSYTQNTNVECCVPETPTPTPSVTPTNTPTPSVTSTNTPTPSVTPTNTPTPSVTPTNTITPTNTTTPTPTPTITQSKPIVNCGLGITTGNYYFSDCCGYISAGTQSGIIVTLNYDAPKNGIKLLNQSAIQRCDSKSGKFLGCCSEGEFWLTNIPSSVPLIPGNTYSFVAPNLSIRPICATYVDNIFSPTIPTYEVTFPLFYAEDNCSTCVSERYLNGACPLPSATPTNTPTQTPTSTNTPTPTPTVTPTITSFFTLENECNVFTCFPMGIEIIELLEPSGASESDGIITVRVSGGTAPYSYFWVGGQRIPTLSGIPPGTYQVTVTDFYGDFTQTATYTLFGPTPTPSTTPTNTPTPSTTPLCGELCIISVGELVSYGPWQFICNGEYNNRKTWNYDSVYNIVWNLNLNRWEVVESDMVTPVLFDSGIMVSYSQSTIPLSSWEFLGGTGALQTITVTNGICPANLPLTAYLEVADASCLGAPDDGSIIVNAQYGVPPYQYSINNGMTYGAFNVFNSLGDGTYTVKVKDSVNTEITQIAVVNRDLTDITYTVSVVSLGSITTNQTNILNQYSQYQIVVDPPLPNGTSINFNLLIDYQIKNMGPYDTTPENTAQYSVINEVFKNGNSITLPTPSALVQTSSFRPKCAPSTILSSNQNYVVPIEITSGDIITGNVLVLLEELNPTTLNNCVSTIESDIQLAILSPSINGCTCCSVSNTQNSIIFSETLVGTI